MNTQTLKLRFTRQSPANLPLRIAYADTRKFREKNLLVTWGRKIIEKSGLKIDPFFGGRYRRMPSPPPLSHGERVQIPASVAERRFNLGHMLALEVLLALHLLQTRQAALEFKLQPLPLINAVQRRSLSLIHISEPTRRP